MSEKEIQRGDIVIASAGMLLYRDTPDRAKVLAGKRRNEPWAGYNLLVFGGLVKASDENVLQAAHREAHEETGGMLKITPQDASHIGTFELTNFKEQNVSPIGVFGPKSWHHVLALDESAKEVRTIKTGEEISAKYKFLMTVFAGLVLQREMPPENDEVYDFRWVDPVEFARNKSPCAFDQALALEKFCWLYKRNYHGTVKKFGR